MKFIGLLILLFACVPSKKPLHPVLFNPEEVKSFTLIHEGASDTFSITNKVPIENQKGYQLSRGETSEWLERISEIETRFSKKVNKVLDLQATHFIELSLHNGTKIGLQGNESSGSILVRLVNSDASSKGKIIHIDPASFPKIFPDSSDLRLKKLALPEKPNINYTHNGKTVELTMSQAQEITQILNSLRISSYVHSGSVSQELLTSYRIGLRENGNIPGELRLKSQNEDEILVFGRPDPIGARVLIFIYGRNEIYETMLPEWYRLESIIRSALRKN